MTRAKIAGLSAACITATAGVNLVAVLLVGVTEPFSCLAIITLFGVFLYFPLMLPVMALGAGLFISGMVKAHLRLALTGTPIVCGVWLSIFGWYCLNVHKTSSTNPLRKPVHEGPAQASPYELPASPP
jgi:hypothetical protein